MRDDVNVTEMLQDMLAQERSGGSCISTKLGAF